MDQKIETVSSPKSNLAKFLILSIFMILSLSLLIFLGSTLHMNINKNVKSNKILFDIEKKNIQTLTLSNGMRVVVFKNTLKPKVLLRICYDVGSSSENSSEKGFAHLVEHLIFKGTQKLSESDIDTISRKYGATMNAATSYDTTSYFFEVSKNDWKPFVGIMADCMENARFDHEHLASELRAVVQELNMGKDSKMRQVFYNIMEQIFPANHPYHFPVIGFREELASVTADDVKKFYQRHYSPDRALMIVIGDVEPKEVFEKVKEEFGHIEPKANALEEYPNFPETMQTLSSKTTTIYQDVSNEEYFYFWPIPGREDLVPAQWDLLNSYFGDGASSRLSKILIDKETLAEEVSSNLIILQKGGCFLVQITPKPGCTQRCEDVLVQEIKKLQHELIDVNELNAFMPGLALSFIKSLQNFSSISFCWMASIFANNSPEEYFDYIKQLNSTTPLDAKMLAEKYLSTDLLRKIIVSPMKEGLKEVWRENNKILKEQEDLILKNHQRTTTVEEPVMANELAGSELIEIQFPNPSNIDVINDLEVITHYDARLPISHFMLKFKNDTFFKYSKERIKHSLMMNLLIEGSLGADKEDHLNFFSKMGAEVSLSAEGVSCTVASSNFLPVLERVFYIIKKPTFKKDCFEKLKAIMVNNIKAQKDIPENIAKRYIDKNSFKNSSFDWDYEEALQYLNNISLKDVVSCYQELSPKSCIAGIAGNVNHAENVKSLNAFTKNWNRSGEFEKKELPIPTFNSIPNKNIKMLKDQALLTFANFINTKIDDPELAFIWLANVMTFASLGSKMYKIREETGLFYGLSGSFAQSSTDLGSQQFIMTKVNPSKLLEAEKAIASVIKDIMEKGFSEDELLAAKAIFQNKFIDNYSSAQGTLEYFLNMKILNQDYQLYEKAWNAIRSASTKDILLALQKRLNFANWGKVIVSCLDC